MLTNKSHVTRHTSHFPRHTAFTFQVMRAVCAWSTCSGTERWDQIGAAIEQAQARYVESKIQKENWGSSIRANGRGTTVFQAITFGAGSSQTKDMKLFVSNLTDIVTCDSIDLKHVNKFSEFVTKEACTDLDLFGPAIAEIALADSSIEDKRQAACVGARALVYLVTQLCVDAVVQSGSGGTVNNGMLSSCVALEAFEQFFLDKGVCGKSEVSIRITLESVLERTKRQVTVKFNALFEGIVKQETFSDLSQIDGSSSSSTDMCSLLRNLTEHFVTANVPISHRWWAVPIHVMDNLIDRYIEFNAATGPLPDPALPKVVHKQGGFGLFKSSDKHNLPGGRRASQFDISEASLSNPEGVSLWGSKAEEKRLKEQRMEELVARCCS